MRSATGTAPRQRHSPRVRRLANEHGVEPDRLTGTGPLGRVVSDDVLRAAHHRAPHHDSPRARRPAAVMPLPPGVVGSSAPVSAPRPVAAVVHESVVLEVDATGLQAAHLLVRVVGAAVAAVRYAAVTSGSTGTGSPEVDVVLHRHDVDGSPVTVTAAHDLNADALAAAVAVTGTGTARPDVPAAAGARAAALLAVHDLTDLRLRSGLIAPGPDELVALTVGAPTTRVVAVEADGGTGAGLRAVAEVTLSWDRGRLTTPQALALVRDVSRRLERDVAGRVR